MSERKYKFSWDTTIGTDMDTARPSLGPSTRLEVYRLFQFSVRDVLEQRYGTNIADEIFREAGSIAGQAFYEKFCKDASDINSLIQMTTDNFSELGIGILRIEQADMSDMSFTFTVDEDLDCSGMPDTSDVICVYDEGFLQGILESYSGKSFHVREVDCWCTGARSCRFTALSKS